MPDILQLERDFMQAILEPGFEPAAFGRNNIAEKLAIYRDNISANLLNALALTYPGVWQLLGTDCANSYATLFLQDSNNYPSSGILDSWGENYIQFLRQTEPRHKLPYLADYAKFEWLKHCAYIAKPLSVVNADALAEFDDSKILQARTEFIPALFYMQSSHPILEIATSLNENIAPKARITGNDSHLLIIRPQREIQVMSINNSLACFIQLLQAKYNLEQAVTKVMDSDSSFQAAEALGFLLGAKLLHRIIV